MSARHPTFDAAGNQNVLTEAASGSAGVWPDGAPESGHDFGQALARTPDDADGKVIWPAD